MFQSTFPQGERLYRDGYYVGKIVSIHVPARGTTYAFRSFCNRRFSVSIHVPARGTTLRLVQALSTHPVSIHVPARGTTGFINSFTIANLRFQSTFPQGERPVHGDAWFSVTMFQSTFPQGERLNASKSDLTSSLVSIHVPARGTTTSAGTLSIY